ncbi:hypothetical protein FHR90_003107 [Endobacter medicaginis]|uniref:Uncharacterized protein n=1 Tax=Endobacter medicaginis TaxID=1181271 RepID=A0A839V398_9PROT|nr:hypothetical protein [Endobacter medicaginis]MBB3175253.1 hypothetical protein [Endobacter medicaginis]MCX5476593.1 hypothetical protein [Endobacter medicaginis]
MREPKCRIGIGGIEVKRPPIKNSCRRGISRPIRSLRHTHQRSRIRRGALFRGAIDPAGRPDTARHRDDDACHQQRGAAHPSASMPGLRAFGLFHDANLPSHGPAEKAGAAGAASRPNDFPEVSPMQ